MRSRLQVAWAATCHASDLAAAVLHETRRQSHRKVLRCTVAGGLLVVVSVHVGTERDNWSADARFQHFIDIRIPLVPAQAHSVEQQPELDRPVAELQRA